MRWLYNLTVAACMLIMGIVWCIDKVRALCGKESLLARWTNQW